MKRIAVLTSGGDAPGMNAAVRAVVRAGIHQNLEVFGVYGGYQGLLDNAIEKLNRESVGGIISQGGTILLSSRCQEFRTPEGRTKAAKHLSEHGIEGLVVIGGDGSFAGANLLHKEHGISVIGIPGTIDNDLYGTDFTIGYDTAVNTAVEAIDKIKDTAESHGRIFFVEVMGRDSGYIAIRTAVACGAVAVAIPEDESSVDRIADQIQHSKEMRKRSSIVVTAEGKTAALVHKVVDAMKARTEEDQIRYIALGHIQRGGAPSALDRILASRLGLASVEALISGRSGETVGVVKDQITFNSIERTISEVKPISTVVADLVPILA